MCGAQSGTGLLSQPTVLGQANQVLHPESGPYAPGQNLLPLGNLRTVDFGGPYNNGVYNSASSPCRRTRSRVRPCQFCTSQAACLMVQVK